MRGLLFILFAASLIFAVLSQNCTWSAWSQWTTCTDTCGSCGNETRSRSCANQSSACICSGNSTQIQNCNAEVCIFPRNSCCIGAPSSLDGMFMCALNATVG